MNTMNTMNTMKLKMNKKENEAQQRVYVHSEQKLATPHTQDRYQGN